jgi:hypothetical protein
MLLHNDMCMPRLSNSGTVSDLHGGHPDLMATTKIASMADGKRNVLSMRGQQDPHADVQ